MKVDFDAIIKDAFNRDLYEHEIGPNGLPVQTEVTGADGQPQHEPKLVPVTLRQVCVAALTRRWPQEHITETVAFERFMLATRVADGGSVDLTLAERGMIQAATDNWHTTSPIFMARARLLLDAQAGAA